MVQNRVLAEVPALLSDVLSPQQAAESEPHLNCWKFSSKFQF